MARRGELRSIAAHDGTNLAELLLLIGQATVREMAWDVDLIDYVVAPNTNRAAKVHKNEYAR